MSGMVFATMGVGLALLIVGAELLVRGASRLAGALGISPLVVGLTVVAYGTSSPEIAVSIRSALAGQADLAVGNVVGSNICNVLLILGVSSMIAPLAVAQRLVRLDVPVIIGLSLLTYLFALDGTFGRLEGLLFTAGAAAYTVFLVWQSRRESAAIRAEYARELPSVRLGAAGAATQVTLVVGGLALLLLGARWFLDGAIELAQSMGVSELVIALTVVAVGTSLPELATSVLAALRGERDIAVGNVIGSSLFNLLGVLGPAALLSPMGLTVSTAALRFDLPVMIAVAVACLPIFANGNQIYRWEGLIFFAYYGAYTTFLIMDASRHAALPAYSWAMQVFVLPLTAITVGVIGYSAWKQRSAVATRRPAAG